MNWADEPATWRQLKQLRQSGYNVGHRLTKTEAAELIGNLAPPQERIVTMTQNTLQMTEHPIGAYDLRKAVEQARRNLDEARREQFQQCQKELETALNKRLEFWVDTCREIKRMLSGSMQVHDLYQNYGCRFDPPSNKEAQFILEALDSAMPLWDREHPELFFQTLELNFPHLLRRH